MKSELVTPTHLARKAVVYIRQSTPHQIVSNQESLRLQYALRQRARELGWHDADIDVIDADLGRSGASAAQRSGFKELVGRVGLSEVGLILSIDVTRLARNCSDWYPLLDICGLRGCLIADRDGVYTRARPTVGCCSGSRAPYPSWSCTRSAAASPRASSPRRSAASWRSPCPSALRAGPAGWWPRTRTSRCRAAWRWSSAASCGCAPPPG